MKEIINTYYMYNRYLLLNDIKQDENTEDIMKILENNTEVAILYILSNSNLLEPIVRDYLTYELLDVDKKNEIINFLNKKEKVFNNPNDKVRHMLKEKFSNINVYDEEDVNDNIDFIKDLKESPCFDLVASILYIDSMYLNYYDYSAYPNDSDLKNNFEYIKNMKSIDEFKMNLLENDMVLLDAINKSITFYDFSFLTKKDVMLTLENDNILKLFLTNNYIFDKLSCARNYDLEDAALIYQENLLSYKDKKLAVAHSVSELSADLLDLSVLYPNNYKDIFFDLTKVYYEYNKYLFDNNIKIEIEDEHILKSIDNNLDDFLVQIENNDSVIERISNCFYKYISSSPFDKNMIKKHYENLSKEGKVKVFNKKKRSSNS